MREVFLELLIGRPRDLARLRPRDAKVRPLVVSPAEERAIALIYVVRTVFTTALLADTVLDHPNVAPAVCGERGGAVRADDAEILKPMVSAIPIDVIEDQRDTAPALKLALTAEFALPLFQTLVVQALL